MMLRHSLKTISRKMAPSRGGEKKSKKGVEVFKWDEDGLLRMNYYIL